MVDIDADIWDLARYCAAHCKLGRMVPPSAIVGWNNHNNADLQYYYCVVDVVLAGRSTVGHKQDGDSAVVFDMVVGSLDQSRLVVGKKDR